MLTAGIVHDSLGLPSMRTVQQPHWPIGSQPFLGDMTFSSSRRTDSSDWSAYDSAETVRPFSSNETVPRAVMLVLSFGISCDYTRSDLV